MSVGLLDVNMLIALAWPSHVHHESARCWFDANHDQGWATCPLTQNAFVRISSNARIIAEAVTPREAIRLLSEMISHRDHVFWPDDLQILDDVVPTDLIVGHRQITDAYLLGLAAHHNALLVTMDGGIANLLPANSAIRKRVVKIDI